MAITNLGTIRIAPDSTGKRLATIEVTVNPNPTDPQGTPIQVECQMVAIVNPDGSILDASEVLSALRELSQQIQDLRRGLTCAFNENFGPIE